MTVWCRFEDAGQSSPGGPVLARPEIGYRANNALTGHLSPIIRPSGCDEPLVAEGELVEVIGRPLRHVTAAEAREGILGKKSGGPVDNQRPAP